MGDSYLVPVDNNFKKSRNTHSPYIYKYYYILGFISLYIYTDHMIFHLRRGRVPPKSKAPKRIGH